MLKRDRERERDRERKKVDPKNDEKRKCIGWIFSSFPKKTISEAHIVRRMVVEFWYNRGPCSTD